VLKMIILQTTEINKNGAVVLKKPKSKVGDMVYRLLEDDNVEDIRGKKQMGRVRMGDVRIDRTQRRISEIVYMNGKGPTFRYLLGGINGTSYEESELRKKL